MGKIADLLHKHPHPHRAALQDGEEYVTFDALLRLLHNASQGSSILESGPEKPVVIVFDQTLGATVALLTLFDLSVPLLTIDSLSPGEDIERLHREWGISAWVVPTGYTLPWKNELGVMLTYEELPQQLERLGSVSSKEAAVFQFTSGTTGGKKIARLPLDRLLIGAAKYTAWFNYSNYDTVLPAVPLNYNYGLVGGLLASLMAGSTCMLGGRLSARMIVKRAKETSNIILLSAPPLFRLLSQSEMICESDLASLKLCLSSGIHLEPLLHQAFLAKFGKGIYQVYGSTETGAVAAQHPLLDDDDATGHILPGVDVEVGDEGLLSVRSRTNFSGYYTREGLLSTDEVGRPLFNDEGYYQTGDLGEVVARRLYLLGRVSPFINVGGRKIDPVRVAEVIGRIDWVREVRVIGERDGLYGEKIIAYVSSDRQVTETELRKHLIGLLAEYEIPHEVRYVRSLPISWKKAEYILSDERGQGNVEQHEE